MKQIPISKEKLSSLLTHLKNNPPGTAIVGGLFMNLAFPPAVFFFFAFFGMIPLWVLAENAKKKHLYLFFLSWNFFSTYWLMFTALSAPDFGEALLSLTAGVAAITLNSLLMLIPALIYRKYYARNLPLALTMFILSWLTFEYIHFHWEFAWPWLALGHVFAYVPWYVNYLQFTGILGASLFVLLANAFIYLLLKQKHSRNVARALIFLGILPFFFLLIPDNFTPRKHLNVRIIQPNFDPYQKFEKLSPREQVQRIVALTQNPGIDTIDLVLLPETSIPRALDKYALNTSDITKPLRELMQKYPRLNFAGGFTEFIVFTDSTKAPKTARKYGRLWYEVGNSAFMLSKEIPTPQSYQKAKLVPMVERVPYLEHLVFLKNWNIDLGGGLGNMTKPDSLYNLYFNKETPISVLICYESVFGDHVRKFVKKGGQLLAIVTNDGWWKKTAGHIQHFRYATFRALETKRYIVRSANTGISAVFNTQGKVLAKTKYDEQTYLDFKVPLFTHRTFYVKFGDYLGIFSFIFVFLIPIALWIKKKF